MIRDAEALTAQISVWRRADLSPWEFERRVLAALESAGASPPLLKPDEHTLERLSVERAERNAEIDRVLNGPDRKWGDVACLAVKWNISRSFVVRIAKAART